MLKRQLLTSKRKIIDIESDSQDLIDHFSDTNNYADVVLNQINTDRFYDTFFNGKDDIVVLDIGANIGLFSLYVHDTAKQVYAVEPTPSHFQKLLQMTKNYDNIKPLNIALHDKDEPIQFFTCEFNSTMNSSVNRYENSVPVDVQGKTLRSIIDEQGLTHVDFVKCDIEGSEVAALTLETISAVKDIVDTWFLEVHATYNKSTQDNRFDLIQLFKKAGYKAEPRIHDVIVVTK